MAELTSIITCPAFGRQTVEQIATDACQFYFRCGQCGTLLKPNAGDCCVFCSFGTVPCPPMQAKGPAPGGRHK